MSYILQYLILYIYYIYLASTLTMENVPWHEEVVRFVQDLVTRLDFNYFFTYIYIFFLFVYRLGRNNLNAAEGVKNFRIALNLNHMFKVFF